MEINGVVELIQEEQQINERFKKREFVIDAKEENSSYENFIKFELVQENCSIIDNHKVGDKVSVHFSINGRKWINPKGEEVYFNSLKAWKITSQSNVAQQENAETTDDYNEKTSLVEPDWLKADNKDKSDNAENSDDDLPF